MQDFHRVRQPSGVQLGYDFIKFLNLDPLLGVGGGLRVLGVILAKIPCNQELINIHNAHFKLYMAKLG